MTHFGHTNILEYSSRPFDTIEEHDEALIENWNAKVKPGDTVYHNGDFSLTLNQEEIETIVKRLNGQIHLIYGNHDKKPVRKAAGFAWKGDYKKIKVEGQSIVLFHYAILSYDKVHKGAWHLFGHSHGNLRGPLIDQILNSRPMMDVGVDCHGYAPIAFGEVAEILRQREFVALDHHA